MIWAIKFEKHTRFEKICLMVLTNQLIYLLSKCQNHMADFFKLCVLFKKSELYHPSRGSFFQNFIKSFVHFSSGPWPSQTRAKATCTKDKLQRSIIGLGGLWCGKQSARADHYCQCTAMHCRRDRMSLFFYEEKEGDQFSLWPKFFQRNHFFQPTCQIGQKMQR